MSQTDKILMGSIGLCGLILTAAGFFLAHQSWRAERAAATLDLYSGLSDSPETPVWMAQIKSDLAPPRDARMWELEAERRLRANGLSDSKAAFQFLRQAQNLAPARPSIRMRQAYLALREPQSTGEFNRYYIDWYTLAPHDTTMQVWRMTIAAAGWERLTPQARLMALADAEDLCLRWGRAKTLEIAGSGGTAPQLATTLRLEREKAKCTLP
ncbi:MAG: hypothetical protein O9270_11365 [Aquidulcibacter sp.]|jgi:hypothetical protein|uniref:hypothetical protein n=1 Tax=Aquidulcibacter sp. TaxID=2052990 RepID=UPI0022C31986|nr:hypothetical protein [Aquidulcibacter sp.]MCZ8208774.1 hypothetical protein [Aquidulcibacter sp.]